MRARSDSGVRTSTSESALAYQGVTGVRGDCTIVLRAERVACGTLDVTAAPTLAVRSVLPSKTFDPVPVERLARCSGR